MIYTEVVHLDADNKVLIEVLDGRSVRLTTDAHPCEVFYDGKKVVFINVSGQPYLSLETFNKVFTMIDGKLHTYDITEIDQIGDNVFQCHTMPRTKSSFFVTPMLGDVRNDVKWGQYFVNTFLHDDDKIVILYRFFDVDDYKQFEYNIKKHQRYIGTVEYDHQHVALLFKVPENRMNDLLVSDTRRPSVLDRLLKQFFFLIQFFSYVFNKCCIGECCRGQQKYHKNFIWKYKT